MSTKRQRRSDRAGRGVLRSPGRPSVAQRDERRRFWVAIAGGRSSEDSAVAVGISPAVGVRWFRETGGMPPTHLAPSSVPLSGRYLSIAEREELAMLRVQAHGVREIARRMARAPSTISRELRRNAATRGGSFDYRATTAQWHADRAARRPKPARLAAHAALRAYVPISNSWTSISTPSHRGWVAREIKNLLAATFALCCAFVRTSAPVARAHRDRYRAASPDVLAAGTAVVPSA